MLVEDFDNLLQYNDNDPPPPPPPPPAVTTQPSTPQGRKIIDIDLTTSKQSTTVLSPQPYHSNFRHHQQGLGHATTTTSCSGAVSKEPPSLAKGDTTGLEASQLSPGNLSKTSTKCDNVVPPPPRHHHHLLPKTSSISTKKQDRDNILMEEGGDGVSSQKELSERFSAASVDADFASCNNHNLSCMSYEAIQALSPPSDDDNVCTFSSSIASSSSHAAAAAGGGVSIENILSPAVQLDLQGDSETTTTDSGGRCESASASGDDGANQEEAGAIDLDSFASKELADLFQELRRSLVTEEGSGDGKRALQVKGMAKIGEIDDYCYSIEDGLPLDLVEELDRNARQFSSCM